MKQILLAIILIMATIGCASTTIKKETVPTKQQDIIMYSTSWCGWCKKAKVFLEQNHISYIEKNLNNPEHHKELVDFAKSIGYEGELNAVPLFIIKDIIIVGFNKNAIMCAIGLRKCIETDFIDTRHYSITADYL